MQRDNLSDLTSRDGKTFRNRFTVPFQLFEELLLMANAWFPQRLSDAYGKEVSPIALKLLGTLRILVVGTFCMNFLVFQRKFIEVGH